MVELYLFVVWFYSFSSLSLFAIFPYTWLFIPVFVPLNKRIHSFEYFWRKENCRQEKEIRLLALILDKSTRIWFCSWILFYHCSLDRSTSTRKSKKINKIFYLSMCKWNRIDKRMTLWNLVSPTPADNSINFLFGNDFFFVYL